MARKIAVEIVGDSRSLERAFKRSSKSAQNFNKDVSKTGRARGVFGGLAKGAGLAAGALGAGGLASAAKASLQEMGDAQKATAQTNAALRSTKGAANVSAKHVDKLATSLLNLSGTDDEAIKGSENLLLTFTNIRNQAGKNNDVFDQATKATLDFATAQHKDLRTASIQVGKALNDPVKGFKALKRSGVDFTESQQKQIEQMVKTGDTMGAQKLILKELNKEFGGSAKAAGETLPGKLNILKENLLNLGGTLAEKLTPQITDVVDKMVKWLTNVQNQQTIINTFKGIVEALGTAVGILKGGFQLLSGAVGGNKNAVKLLIGMYAGFKILTIAGKISTLAGSFRGAKGPINRATGASKGFRGSLAGKAGVAGAVVLAGWELSRFIRKIPGWDKKMKQLGGAFYDLAAKIGLVNDQMKQYQGKAKPTQALIGGLRQQAAILEAGGLTRRQAASRLARQHPNVARHDINVAAGVYGRAPTVNINNLVVNPHNYKQLEDDIVRRAKRRAHPRRG